jgi:hypothetical protein
LVGILFPKACRHGSRRARWSRRRSVVRVPSRLRNPRRLRKKARRDHSCRLFGVICARYRPQNSLLTGVAPGCSAKPRTTQPSSLAEARLAAMIHTLLPRCGAHNRHRRRHGTHKVGKRSCKHRVDRRRRSKNDRHMRSKGDKRRHSRVDRQRHRRMAGSPGNLAANVLLA